MCYQTDCCRSTSTNPPIAYCIPSSFCFSILLLPRCAFSALCYFAPCHDYGMQPQFCFRCFPAPHCCGDVCYNPWFFSFPFVSQWILLCGVCFNLESFPVVRSSTFYIISLDLLVPGESRPRRRPSGCPERSSALHLDTYMLSILVFVISIPFHAAFHAAFPGSPVQLAAFFRFMQARETARVRKELLNLPAEQWYADYCVDLSKVCLTNLRREADRATSCLRSLLTPSHSVWEEWNSSNGTWTVHQTELAGLMVFHCALWRSFGTVGFMQAFGFHYFADWNPATKACVIQVCLECRARGEPCFTQAYGPARYRANAERPADVSKATLLYSNACDELDAICLFLARSLEGSSSGEALRREWLPSQRTYPWPAANPCVFLLEWWEMENLLCSPRWILPSGTRRTSWPQPTPRTPSPGGRGLQRSSHPRPFRCRAVVGVWTTRKVLESGGDCGERSMPGPLGAAWPPIPILRVRQSRAISACSRLCSCARRGMH